MNRLSKWALAMVVGLTTIAPAFASPAGTWEIEYRDSRYDVTLCGDGTELCAKLIWLGNGADTEENLPYLNTFLINQAKPDGEGRWKGDLHLYGQTASGTIEQVSDDEMTITGCLFLVACRTFRMYRMD
ncbi:MAG: DUF2147 domain-containing protein [Devosia sp.]|uniref:DUF2147 domain-containing protein n=1 Tax=Devosia sp. TaxID=1871048 RepID=UPI0024CC54B6|nr:DUF2147 domain-containing protein [Devosia sp.]UYO00990.1 MAG: DUF2147 domain-containing protein [Devosia sp.]